MHLSSCCLDVCHGYALPLAVRLGSLVQADQSAQGILLGWQGHRPVSVQEWDALVTQQNVGEYSVTRSELQPQGVTHWLSQERPSFLHTCL